MDNPASTQLFPALAERTSQVFPAAPQARDTAENGAHLLSPSVLPLDRIPGASEAPLGNLFLGGGEPAAPSEPPCPVFRGECHPRLGHGAG
jgi:hypothetical protein